MTKMKTTKAIAVAAAVGAVAAFGAVAPASAATLDFVAEAAGNERGVADGTVINMDGLNVTFNSSHFAYFDDLSGGLPGGLGVCKNLVGAAQCSPSSDDNITSGESVTLSFAQSQTLSGHTFTDETHNAVSLTDTLLLGINGGALASVTFGQAMAAILTPVSSITYAWGGGSPSQFYVNGLSATPVPLPAGLVLLLSGLMGLGFLGRSRKA